MLNHHPIFISTSTRSKKKDRMLIPAQSSELKSTYEYNHRLLHAKRNGNLKLVISEFVAMKKSSIALTHHTYNLVLEAHAILRREGTPLHRMLKIYNEMTQHMAPNTYTYTLMIRSLCKRDVEVQKTVAMLNRQSLRIGQPNNDIHFLGTEHNLSKALLIFHEAVSLEHVFEIDIYNQLLRVLSHYGDTADATFVYAQIVQPNSATFAAMINLLGRAGQMQAALDYYHLYLDVKDSLGPHDTSYIYNALVDCHLKCGALDGALKVVEDNHQELKRTCIPYNSIIRHYCTHDAMQAAEELIERLLSDLEKYPQPDASSYGPLLSAYCQAQDFDRATKVYDQLVTTDISKAYGNLANYALLCLSHGEPYKALSVVEDMIQARLEPDPALGERIVVSFAIAEEFAQAVGALHTMQSAMSSRSINKGGAHLFTAAMAIIERCDSVRHILLTMHTIHGEPTLDMYNCLMDCYFEQTQVQALTTKDFQVLFDAALQVYCDEAALGDVVIQLLQDMRACEIQPPQDLYSHVLSQLEKLGDLESESRWKAAFVIEPASQGQQQQEDDDDIIILIEEEEEVMPSTKSSRAGMMSNLVLKSIMHGQDAIAIFEDKLICQGLIPTPDIMCDSIVLAGKQGDIATALTLYNNCIYAFKDIQDIQQKERAIHMVTNAIMSGYAQQGEMERAKVYYDRIKAMGHYPDANGYASLLLGSVKSTDEATDALSLYEEAKQHAVQPTTFFYNVVISKLAKARKLDVALKLFDEMQAFNIPANSITYGALISASVRSGSEVQSRRLFHAMLNATQQPRVGPFNNMMQFYVRQQPDRAQVLSYFAELHERDIKPSPHSYKLLMEAYTHIAPYDMLTAHKLLGDMQRRDKLRPQATHYATLIYSYGLLQRDVISAERVFLEMKKVSIIPDEAVYQAMIDTFITNNELSKAEKLYFEEMQQDVHLIKSSSPYIENLLIRGYGEKNMLDKAEKIFQDMVDEKRMDKVVREPSTFEAMIRAYLVNDQLEQAERVLANMVKRDFPAKVVAVVADLVM